jgi:pimeloyl-ACP methyl ester carboxylesterase
VSPLLDAAGVASVSLDLPGHGASTEPLSDFAGDVAALRAAIDDIDSPDVVLCAHSYGGAVATQAAFANRQVRHLVYIAAFPLAPGESVMNAAANEVGPEQARTDLATAIRRDGEVLTLDRDLAIPIFYGDCPPAIADEAADRLGPQSLAEMHGTATNAAWNDIPSTYVVCAQDRVVAPVHQRVMARRCTETREWPTAHSPQLSRPDLVADLCIDRAGAAG